MVSPSFFDGKALCCCCDDGTCKSLVLGLIGDTGGDVVVDDSIVRSSQQNVVFTDGLIPFISLAAATDDEDDE